MYLFKSSTMFLLLTIFLTLTACTSSQSLQGLNNQILGKTALDAQSFSNSDYVTMLYHNLLGRSPDAAGFQNWVSQLNSGTKSLEDVLRGFLNSSEYQTKNPQTPQQDYVTALYYGLLSRAPDAGGLQFWTTKLESGEFTRSEVLDDFIHSDEYISKHGNPVTPPAPTPTPTPPSGGFDVIGSVLAGHWNSVDQFCARAATVVQSCVTINGGSVCGGFGPCLDVISNNFTPSNPPPPGPTPINGSCGSANGQNFNSAPTAGLCSSGNATGVTQLGANFNWSCLGSNGGANSSCSANYVVAPPPSPTPPSPPPTGRDLCAQYKASDSITNILRTTLNWPQDSVHSRDLGSFPGRGFWILKFTATSGFPAGNLAVAEYGGPSTPRDATLSLSPCDFRPVDHTGVNGPIARSDGTTASIQFVMGANVCNPFAGNSCAFFTPGLQSGQTYYFNVRNWYTGSGYDDSSNLPALVNLVPQN